MKKVKAVMFDYDGTLMDTNEIIIESWNHTFRRMNKALRPVEELYATFGEPLYDTMKSFFPQEDTEACIHIYRSYQEDCYEKLILLFPGMEQLVRDLRQQGYLTAVVTSRLPATTMQGLEKYGLTDCFDAIVTCADTDKHKPDPEPVLVCARKLGIEASEAVMVGDTTFDLICGNRAGAKTVLVSWSAACGGGEPQGEAKPDFVADSAEAILAYVKEQQ